VKRDSVTGTSVSTPNRAVAGHRELLADGKKIPLATHALLRVELPAIRGTRAILRFDECANLAAAETTWDEVEL
jgi:hypothetical protein